MLLKHMKTDPPFTFLSITGISFVNCCYGPSMQKLYEIWTALKFATIGEQSIIHGSKGEGAQNVRARTDPYCHRPVKVEPTKC